jgi:dipeptidase
LFALGEKWRAQFLELPQARQTYSVVGNQPPGLWGFRHGVNEHGVAVGCGLITTRLPGLGLCLLGTDLVRLALERSRSARQAVDVLSDLIRRYGQGALPSGPLEAEGDSSFLIADAQEAFAVEASAAYWVYQEVRELRALSDICTIHQDWDRISSGLAAEAIGRGWWPGDGTKLDFASAIGRPAPGREAALRRWGRATLLLEQQNGQVDTGFVRRLLADHFDGTDHEADPCGNAAGPVPLCRHARTAEGETTVASLVAQLPADPEAALPVAWCSFGPPCVSVYFPVFVDGELPEGFRGNGSQGLNVWRSSRRLEAYLGASQERWVQVREQLGRLQAQFDHEAEDFAAEGAALKQRGAVEDLQRLAGLFMQHCVEKFEEVVAGLRATPPSIQRTMVPTGS